MDRLQRLTAIEDIRLLKARYFRAVDTKDWKELTTLFTDDMVFDRTYASSVQDPWSGEWVPSLPGEMMLVRGREAVLAMVRAAVEELRTIHHGHDPEIELIGADEAVGIWAMTDELRDREGRLILAGRGHYHDTYRRTGAGWKIASSRLTRLALISGDGERP